jgi:Abnormal spindle-like microcephaly-assoc'd, ASPM-SPD-2-Hydin
LPDGHDDVIVRPYDGGMKLPPATGSADFVKKLLCLGALAAAAVALPVFADNNVANGKNLYLGNDNLSYPTGSYACTGCHDVNDTTSEMNKLFRGAANDPGLIDDAININPDSTTQMRPLYGVGSPYELSPSDESDLAAYINSVVNPGGGNPPPPPPPPPPTGGSLSGPASLAFGSQALFLQSAPKTLTLTNSGATTVAVAAIAVSDPGEFPLLSSTCGNVAAGASCTISVAFAPALAGARSATLTVTNNGAVNPFSVQLSGTGASAGGSGTKVTVVEYYDATFDHYFITSVGGEISALGKPPFDDWQPTGLTFQAYAPTSPPAGTVGVCRFFNDHFNGVSTHFYAPHGLGCEQTIADFPDWTLEDPNLFFANLPDAAGNCPSGQIPVYRLYNNGIGGAPNHRFTIDAGVRQQMIAKGYAPEGAGIGVGWCAPQ